MSILSRIRTALAGPGAEKSLGDTQNPSQQFVNLLGGAATSSGVRVDDMQAMSDSAFSACVRVINDDVAKLQPMLWRAQADGSRVEATDHPLHALLDRPHRLMGRVAFFRAMASAYAIRGNALAVILRDGRGRPTGLWPIYPSQVSILESPDGFLFYAISRRTPLENAVLRNVPIMVPDYDIFHVRAMSLDGVVGLSPLALLREDVGVSIAGQEMSGSMLRNGAQVGGVLKHPGKLTDGGVVERLRASWNQRFRGTRNAGSTVILEEGMSFEPMAMTSVDAQFIEQRKLAIENISRGMRVPLHMINVPDKLTNSNANELTRAYYDQTLMPILESFEDEFKRAFNLPPGVYVEFDVKRLLRADFKTRQEGQRTMFQSGALMPNEWRVEEGYNPSPAGRVFARPLNTAYVNEAGDVVSVTPAGGADPVFGAGQEGGGPTNGSETEGSGDDGLSGN